MTTCGGGCFTGVMGKFMSKSRGRDATYGTSYEEQLDHTSVQSPVTEVQQYPPCHQDAVTSIVPMSPGVSFSGSKDQTAAVFDFITGKICQRWTGHEREVTKVAYGKIIQCYFSGSRDKNVYMWRDNQSSPVVSFRGHDLVVTAVTLNDQNTHLCTGSRDNWLKIWDVEAGCCLLQNSISRNLITHAKWGENSTMIAQTSEDKELRLWDSNSLQVIQTFPRKKYIQTCCDISQDLNYCLTSSNGFQGNGCEATLWDLRTGRLICEFKGHTETVAACSFLPSVTGVRSLLATSSNDCTVRIWDQNSAECVASMSLSGSGPLTSIAGYQDGSLCVSSFNSGIYVLRLMNDLSLTLTAKY